MIRQHPFQEIYSLFDSMIPDTMLPTSRRPRLGSSALTAGMPIDSYATEDQAVVLASVPGIPPEDISVSVKKDTVTITASTPGERQREDEHGKPVTWYMSEIPRGSYERQLRLPFVVDEAQVEAQFANGMLRIVLPRAEKASARKIDVKVQNGRFPEIAAARESEEKTTE